MFPDSLASQLSEAGFVAVLVIDRVADAVPLAESLRDGGVRAMELTLRTPVAIDALKVIRDAVPEMIAGVGTVLQPTQVLQIREAGAQFAVAPGTNPRVVAAAREAELPFAPGICTPTDLELAVEQGCRLLKFFPADPIGGPRYLNSIASPLAHLGVRFIPLGGIDSENMERYLTNRFVDAVGGSWVTPKELINQQDWAAIRGLAEQASSIVARVRQHQHDSGTNR